MAYPVAPRVNRRPPAGRCIGPMGEVIDLARHRDIRARDRHDITARDARSHGPPARPGWAARLNVELPPLFAFDLADPFAYLAVERVERRFPGAEWRPVSGDAFHGSCEWRSPAAHLAARRSVEARARALRLPLAWPAAPPAGGLAALRGASFAAESGAGGSFAVAAARLAWCGGFDLDGPELLAEAAAAAGLAPDDVLAAAADEDRDAQLRHAASEVRVSGADRLPVLVAAGRAFCGEERLAEAVLALGERVPPGTPVAG